MDEDKPALRARMRRRLESIEPTVAAHAAGRVAEQVLALPELVSAGGILACLSFGHEIDTRRLVDHLVASGREVYVPRAEPRGRRRPGAAGPAAELCVHRYPCRLEKLGFGLEQPLAGEPSVPPEEVDRLIDVVLVLGLAFDRSGFRLGYGAGHFDRFLADRALTPIGLAYDCQVVDVLPREAHDIPMALVVTETGALRPTRFLADF